MLAKLVVIFGFVVSLIAGDDVGQWMQQAQKQWPGHKQTFGLKFSSSEEDQRRFNIYANNHVKIERHNRRFKNGEVRFDMKLNQFSHLTREEFKKLNGLPRELPKDQWMKMAAAKKVNFNTVGIPTNFDWRTKQKVTPIKDQASCGACWAFATIATIESQVAIKRSVFVDLSEQELIDCIPKELYNYGCNGGNFLTAMAYYNVTHEGIVGESAYPYRQSQGVCVYNSRDDITHVTGVTFGANATFGQMKSVCYNSGPVAVAINAVDEFMHYHSGVFDQACPNNNVDHAVTIVGYENDAYIIKNSWGAVWGEKGFGRVKHDICGIENHLWSVPAKGASTFGIYNSLLLIPFMVVHF